MLGFLKFGKTDMNNKHDPIKLLKLLDIFDGLNKMRHDSNKLFRGKSYFNI
jgi:exocyst complex protein 7